MNSIGFSTQSRDLDFLKSAFDNGLNAIELWCGNPDSFEEQRAWLRKLRPILDHYSIRRSIHLQMFNIGDPNPGIGAEMLRQHEIELAIGEEVGAEIAVIHPGMPAGAAAEGYWPLPDVVEEKVRNALSVAHQVTRERFSILTDIATQHGIRLAAENLRMPPRPVGMSIADAKQSGWYGGGSTIEGLLDLMSVDDRLGMTLDVGHALLAEIDAVELIHRLGERVIHVHIQDGTGEFDAHNEVGAGNVDFPAILSALDGIEFRGMMIMEIKGADLETYVRSRDRLQSLMPEPVGT
jgi:sugar phosphate isomerase/epimerase